MKHKIDLFNFSRELRGAVPAPMRYEFLNEKEEMVKWLVINVGPELYKYKFYWIGYYFGFVKTWEWRKTYLVEIHRAEDATAFRLRFGV